MARANELQEAVASGAAAAPLGYVCAFESGTAQLPDGTLAKHEGLKAVQTVRVQDGKTLHIAFWKSREHHDLSSAELTDSTDARVVFEGVAAPLIVKKTPWFKQIRLSTWLLSVVAFLGALDALAHRYEQLFTSPNALVTFDQRKYEIGQDEKLAATVTVENLLGVADLRDVEVDISVDAPPSSKFMIGRPDQAKPSILATKTRAFPFEIERLPPGTYTIKAKVTANGGYLRWWSDSFEQATRVRVFPRHPRGSLLATGTGLSTEAVALIPTAVALKASAVCEISFAPGPHFQFEPTYTGDKAVWEAPTGDDGLMRAALRWKPGATPAKSDVKRTFRLAAAAPLDWSKIAAAATVACSQEQEGL